MMMTEKQMKAQAQARRAAKRRKAIRNRMILACVIVTLAALLVAGIALNIKKANAASEAEEIVYTPTHSGVFVEYYHDIKLGESLGLIAKNYIQQYNSSETVDDVVNRIINYNGLDRKEATYHLQAGTRIVVPLWIAEDRNPYHTTTEESQN